MSKEMRLDKLLGCMGIGSRKELKEFAKRGEIKVNGEVVKSTSLKLNPELDIVEFRGEKVVYREFIYLMLNKPKGYISATEDDYHKTVVELLSPDHLVFSPYPVGRLDLDTTGLLLITNDGKLTHELLSPKKKVPKTYFAEILGEVGEPDIALFESGIYLAEEDYTTMPAELKILSSGRVSQVEVTIMEGKYHQVKRMFEKSGKRVLELKRLSMGPITLDQELSEGEYRELSDEEISLLKCID